MAVFSVDSDAVLSATAAMRGTMDRVHGDTAAMLALLTQLQGSWTGSASVAFQSALDQWRAAQHQVEEALTAINAALSAAGAQYAETEAATASLFR
ncbi:WXG100 family type VII secretion target [Microbacterium sp. X-17]|uniref:WXG100 family type VII secretion target n=1 Tax=Microbacterium sp. X-17 TaxID=3144404 RepID=UPI0031F5663C